jgi:hypothetical protein
LCYNRKWNSFWSGGVTFAVFALSNAITSAAYVATAFLVKRALLLAMRNTVAQKSSFTILKRGASLVLVFFATWTLFIVVVLMSLTGNIVNINLEMIASLCPVMQPIVDAFVILTTPEISCSMRTRLLASAKGNSEEENHPPTNST